MVSLVAEYGSSSSSESDEEEIEDCVSRNGCLASTTLQTTLVNPFRSSPSTILTDGLPFLPPVLAANQSLPPKSVSVFSNPYQEAENAKQSVLEKHVKMTPNSVSQNNINGRQVCWNYRKGRCRFGHNCKFVHDSDLVTNPAADEVPSSPIANEQETEKLATQTHRKRKKRPGLSQGLVPSKRVMKSFYKQQKQESITSK